METLYQSFIVIPIESVGQIGLVQLVLIIGMVIFKVAMPSPKK